MEAFFKGCVSVARQGPGYTAQRFSAGQLKHYAQASEGYKNRAISNAGVRIACQTDAPCIAFDFVTEYSSDHPLSFDVYENGRFVHSLAFEVPPGSGRLEYQRRPEPGSVEVYLPMNARVRVENLDLGANARPASPAARRYLALGDSITQGFLSAYTSRGYAASLARRWNAELLNQGVGGYHFDAGALDFMPSFKPDIITVAYGTNDYRVVDTARQIAENAEAFAARLRALYPHTQAVLITPLWRGDLDAAEKQRKFADIRDALNGIGRAYGMQVLDGCTLVPNQAAFFTDGYLHPNAQGFEIMTENIAAAVRLESEGPHAVDRRKA